VEGTQTLKEEATVVTLHNEVPPERADILNIGGFSDAVFNVVASYLGDDAGRFVAEVESIEL
jgi:hypothetical protein